MSKLPPKQRMDYSGLAVGKPSRKERTPKEQKKVPVKAVNRGRASERRADAFGVQAMACRRLPCVACGKDGPSEVHHEPPRSVGGDDRSTLSLCRDCHQRRHNVGQVTFWADVGLDPRDLQEAIREWIASGKPPTRIGR